MRAKISIVEILTLFLKIIYFLKINLLSDLFLFIHLFLNKLKK